MLTAIAGVLRLDKAEQAHLFALARRPPAARRQGTGVQQVRPAIDRLMDSLTEQPAFALGRRTDVLAINRLGRALIADYPAMPAAARNKTNWVVLDPAAHDLYPDWEAVAAEVVGTLRRDAGRYPDDPRTAELVGELAMNLPADADQTLFIYTAADQPSQDALRLLASWTGALSETTTTA